MPRSRTILVVDDVPMFRDLVALFLTRTARVLQATSGEQALAILAREPVDLLIADLHMPGMDGAALCARVRAQVGFDNLPILMLLRPEVADDAARAVRAGANDMLCKPIARDRLIEAVNHFLEQGLASGLPRVALRTPVQLRSALLHTWGTTRNISRGGISLEADCELEPKSEVAVEITLPESNLRIAPVAEVIWSREVEDRRLTEMGLRFVSIEGAELRGLDDFISEHTQLQRGLGGFATL